MEIEKGNTLTENDINDLADIFDLLARFDYEDNKPSEVNTGIADSAPAVPLLGSESNR